MRHGLFIAGTDTGVGKTVVAAGMLRWLRGQGIDAVPMKPVQTGAERLGAEKRGGELVAPDLEFCLQAAGLRPTPEERRLMSPFLYEPACSPHLAGRMAGRYPEIPVVLECADKLLQRRQAVIVEGAGGIMAPLNEQVTTLELIKEFGLPVLLVSRAGLGAINHALLSIKVLGDSGVELAGIVLNRAVPSQPEDRFIEEDNLRAIAHFGGVRVLGDASFMGAMSDNQAVWARFEKDVPGLTHIRQMVERR
jgi:dethiobiotin synthetase